MLIYAHAPHTTTLCEDSWLVLRSGFIISPTDLHTAIQGKTKICRGSLIFPFLEGRASAASGTKSPRGLVDVHHHENTGFLFQVSPWVGGDAESHSVTTDNDFGDSCVGEGHSRH